jgi:homogentisate 1,2-dioxygenase
LLKPADDFLESRKAMLVNKDCTIAAPKKSLTEYFYKNADADEFHPQRKGNYAPCWGIFLLSTTSLFHAESFTKFSLILNNRLFYVESFAPFYTPKRYKTSRDNI